ncbi:hypothetical protein [Oceanirhabdus seepicola]|uniref:Uncharacterized protein n=1 Tax=Oceanirhabdus seepicola TaxID=2828781 RepID=A0A9J6P725_9CLOT|nr:hypothetical protein [Oceanirhabdus seepicola]MCM1991312.1 hypothetical protein [Oceanirhabdus seepicola]
MSNLIFYILSEYQGIIREKENKVNIKQMWRKLKSEKFIVILFILFLLLLSYQWVIVVTKINERHMLYTSIVLVILMVVINKLIDKREMRDDKLYYEEYEKSQKKFKDILETKYNIKTLEQLEKLIGYCEYYSGELKLTNKMDKVINKFIFPVITFIGGLILSKGKFNSEQLLGSMVVIVVLVLTSFGVVCIVKPVFQIIFEFKSEKFRLLKNRLNDLCVRYYVGLRKSEENKN